MEDPSWLLPATASRADAETSLLQGVQTCGRFLVRKRSDPTRKYAISQLIQSGRGPSLMVRHFAVDMLPSGRLTIGESATFASIEELVAHYQNRPIPGGEKLQGHEKRPRAPLPAVP